MSILESILERIATFARNLDLLPKFGYKEAQVRQEFIDPFPVGLGRYCSFHVGGTRKFFVEAKKPSVSRLSLRLDQRFKSCGRGGLEIISRASSDTRVSVEISRPRRD